MVTPVVTPAEMHAIDSSADASIDELIGRAAHAVATEALKMMGGSYGRRVVVVAGPGNNGADGREAAKLLERRGVRCHVVDPSGDPAPSAKLAIDLVIDAAFGTGLSRPYSLPELPEAPTLAVDIPSGVNGLTGQSLGSPRRADRTITFGARKPGLLLGDGPLLAGEVVIASLGLDCSAARCWHLGREDLGRWPERSVEAHKWDTAVRTATGAAGMGGATALVATGAFAAGASYVGVVGEGSALPIEAVAETRPSKWGEYLAQTSDRFGAVVVGPGLDPGDRSLAPEIGAASMMDRPLVLDGGALAFVDPVILRERTAPTVLTPHDGEFARLMGDSPGPNRIDAVRAVAKRYGSTVLLKGPTTCVSDPDGLVMVATAGDQRLATAGSGDVLAGVVAAGLAAGLGPMDAAALGALLHGVAGSNGPAGLTAGMLPDLIRAVRTRPES